MDDAAGWTLQVDPGCDGWRVDRFVAHRVRRLSRSRAARLTVVDLDAPERGPLKKSAAVRAGQRLRVDRPLPDADAEVPEPRVLHADADLVVLDKPAGLATHPTASRYVATVTRWLAREGWGAEPAHRLDVETSGVLVATRSVEMARHLKGAFARHEVDKRYLAVVEGSPAADAWEDATPLGFDASSAVRLKMGPGDLPARTAFRVVRRGPHRALVEARPLTGRQHQIRAHLALAGLPLVGDKLYGPDESLFLASLERDLTAEELERLGHARQALHAARIELPGRDGARLRFEAPLPEELARLV
jgi:23S rRNA pseudouridine1911/1915/1917 synthase